MPVAQAPATEMCGSEPSVRSARPARCTTGASSPNRTPAPTVTVARSRSTSMRGGRSAVQTWTPVVSAIGENECPVPSARIRSLPATSSCSCSTSTGRCTERAENSMFPAQLVPAAPPPATYRP